MKNNNGMMILRAKATNAAQFNHELPYVGITEARKRLWSRLIHRYGQDRVLSHRKALSAATDSLIAVHTRRNPALPRKRFKATGEQ